MVQSQIGVKCVWLYFLDNYSKLEATFLKLDFELTRRGVLSFRISKSVMCTTIKGTKIFD